MDLFQYLNQVKTSSTERALFVIHVEEGKTHLSGRPMSLHPENLKNQEGGHICTVQENESSRRMY